MIENQTSIARYTGNGTITEFSIPFSFYKNADGAPETYQIAVYQRDKGQAERKLDQGTDYSVTWEEATLSGKIVLVTALPNESVLAIIREVPPSQEVEYKANEPFPYDGTNTALDKLTMLVQEHEEALSRKLGVTPTYDKTAEETMADVINAKESAEASAAAAKTSADEAKGYAQEAENAKVGAVGAKDLAVEAADSAELYAQNAEDSKQGADAALSQLNDQVALAQAAATEANAAKQSAQTSADQASSSAQEAKTSEDTAAQQATEATNAQKEATRASISCAINEQRTLSYYNEVKRLADVFNAEPATDTTYGFTRYATEAEADAGELNNVSSTPAQVKKAADKAADKAAADSKTYADNVVASHAGRTDNPHNVTKAQIGLGLVDNTADIDKPISSATQQALDTKANKTDVSASLATKADLVNGVVPDSQLPSQVTNPAKNDLSNVSSISSSSKVQIELDKKVSKSGDTMTGALKVPTADLSVADTTVVNREWVEKKEQTRITNCITKIPQDIKLELNSDGTLTVKAGSKVWYPNGKDSSGNNVFDSVTVREDKVLTTNDTEGESFVFVSLTGTGVNLALTSKCSSGPSAPSGADSGWRWYNTANNFIRAFNDDGSIGSANAQSFPIAIIECSGGKITAINQVFNGFGYIGQTLFALPGVEGLSPGGRNADGSLYNYTMTVSNVLTRAFTWSCHDGQYLFVGQYNTATATEATDIISSGELYNYYQQNEPPSFNINSIWHRLDENKVYKTENDLTWSPISLFAVGRVFNTGAGTNVSSLTIGNPVAAVDMSNTSYLSKMGMPSDRYVDLTLGATNSDYIAPANGYIQLSQQGNSSNNSVSLINLSTAIQQTSKSTTGTNDVFLPVIGGDKFRIFYNGESSSIIRFRFIYAEGEK